VLALARGVVGAAPTFTNPAPPSAPVFTQEENMATLTDLESAICDLPRWARVIKTLQDAKFGPGVEAPDEQDEALRLVIDELYEKAVRVRTMYYQSLRPARGGAESQLTKAAAE
jgi:hypothetical protein